MDGPKKSINAIKSDVCDTTLVVLAWLVIPALLISFSRALEIGWRSQYTGQAMAALTIWGITLNRGRLSYAWRANTILALLVGLGWIGQLATAAPTSYVFFISASAMATVFYGTGAGIAATALALLITAGNYFAIHAGVFPIPTYAAGMAITTWLSRGASIAIAAAGPVIAVAQLSRGLTAELARSEADSEAKSNFLAMMSHELRTPMTAVIGTAELLQQEALSAGQAQKVGRIATASKNLLSLLNDLLDFAKLEAQQMGMDSIAYSLGDVLAEVRDLFAPLAADKGLSVRIENAVTEDAVMGDPARLRQILQNLVGNAIKFTEVGEVSIAARQTGIAAGRGTLVIEVRDTGIGIDSTDQARLFHPFVQSENLRTRRHGGTGLGLAISRRIASLMRGELTVSSELGKGSTFRLSAPIVLAPKGTVIQRIAPTQLGPARAPLRVLLAEDNDAIRDLMQEMIGKRSHTVDAVVNGLEALKAVQAKAYDVVVMDMHMPVMDGREATHLIRALDGPHSKIPIVALTAGLTESQRATYVAAGVDQIVAKPAHWPTLFEAIETRGQTPPGEAFQPGHAPPPAVAALNEAALNDLGSLIGETSLARLLDSFRDGLIEDGEKLEAALQAEDLKAARRTGHRLKGTCRQFGALELAEIGAAIEAATGLDDVARRMAEITPARTRLAAALAARAQSALQDAPG